MTATMQETERKLDMLLRKLARHDVEVGQHLWEREVYTADPTGGQPHQY